MGIERALGFKQHYQLLASYNKRMNQQLYKASFELSHAELEKDLGAFFGSIIGSLNHIVVGDLLWLARFKDHFNGYKSLSRLDGYPKPNSLNDILYKDIEPLYDARSEVDSIIIDWISESKDSDFDEIFTYRNSKGEMYRKVFGDVVGHLFNHQTHHRGQISTLLSQLGKDIGVTDFIVDIPDKRA